MEYLNTKTNEFYSFSELKVKFDDLRVANFTNNFTVKDWNPDFESIEDFISSVGHRLKDCEWMVHSDPEIITK